MESFAHAFQLYTAQALDWIMGAALWPISDSQSNKFNLKSIFVVGHAAMGSMSKLDQYNFGTFRKLLSRAGSSATQSFQASSSESLSRVSLRLVSGSSLVVD